MGQWGAPFTETNSYCTAHGEIVVEQTFIYHYLTAPFEEKPGRGADYKALVSVRVSGDIGTEDAAAIEQWIIGGMKRDGIPPVLRDGANLKPKGGTKMGEKIQLGAKVKDSVTGFVGTVTARCEYLDNPPQVLAEGIDSTGRPISQWINESRAEVQAA